MNISNFLPKFGKYRYISKVRLENGKAKTFSDSVLGKLVNFRNIQHTANVPNEEKVKYRYFTATKLERHDFSSGDFKISWAI